MTLAIILILLFFLYLFEYSEYKWTTDQELEKDVVHLVKVLRKMSQDDWDDIMDYYMFHKKWSYIFPQINLKPIGMVVFKFLTKIIMNIPKIVDFFSLFSTDPFYKIKLNPKIYRIPVTRKDILDILGITPEILTMLKAIQIIRTRNKFIKFLKSLLTLIS